MLDLLIIIDTTIPITPEELDKDTPNTDLLIETDNIFYYMYQI